jgi:hypothetical protein
MGVKHMLLYESDDDHLNRSAAFRRRQALAETAHKAADAAADILEGSREPSSDDIALLHSPSIDPTLRASIGEARKRMWNMTKEQRYEYSETLKPLAGQIEQAIRANGPDFAPLRRLIAPGSFADSADDAISPVTVKFAKREEGPRNAADLCVLVDARIPAQTRRRLLDAKRTLDAAPPRQRDFVRKCMAPRIGPEVDGLRRVVGAEGVAALRRVLEL